MWREFCERCSSLRELDWSLVPRSKEYDQVFSARTWPKLESLTIEIRHVRGRRGSQPHFDTSEFGSFLEALPALRSLKLHVVSTERYAKGSDGFLEEVITRCPHLETFSFHPDILSREGLPSGAMWSTLLAMPRVVDLEVCKLVDVNGSSLVNTLLLSPINLRRHVSLEMNGLVHAAIVKMLRFLDSEDSGHLTQLRISIQVNASRRNYDPSHSHSATSLTITELEKLTERIRERHANTVTRLHVRANRVSIVGSHLDDYAQLVHCELWINQVKRGKVNDCRFKCKIVQQ